MPDRDIRLKILEIVLPNASKVGISKPENIIEICSHFEKYVIGFQQCEEKSASQPQTRQKRSSKKATEEPTPSFLDPAHSG